MQHFKLTVAYDGRGYEGFQIQKRGRTIEGALRQVCALLFKDGYTFRYASRTDTGVHSLGQVILVSADTTIPAEKIPNAFNGNLPKDIVILDAVSVTEDFHPRYHSTQKTYRYQFDLGRYPNPLYRHYAWHIYQHVNVEAMQAGAKYMLGRHDFKGFSSQGSSVKTTERELYEIRWERSDTLLSCYVTGNGFLYHMVRMMMGALIQIGIGYYDANQINLIFETKDRSLVKKMAPPEGLTLMSIKYENTLQNQSFTLDTQG